MKNEVKTTLTIINQLGLHARAATKLVQMASQFNSELLLQKDGREVNGKSIMGVLLLTASAGDIIEATSKGPDCVELMDAVIKLVEDKFGEDK